MEDLLQWLKAQHKGLRTYKTFQRKVLDIGAKNKDQYAVYFLLGALVERFVETYDEEPLTLDVTEKAHKQLIAITEKAVQFDKMQPAQQIALLNEIAALDLG